MSVDFDEKNNFTQNSVAPKGLLGFLIKKGIASDIKQANIILIFVGLISIILTGLILNFYVFDNVTKKISNVEIGNKIVDSQNIKGVNFIKSEIELRKLNNKGIK